MSVPIIIEEYDPRWPAQFEMLKTRISAALGGLTAAIEHVGSTAIPGLAAKPIIDIDILLRSGSDLSLAIDRLAPLGYKYQGDLGIAGREAFRAPTHDISHHLYACPPGSLEYTGHIAFRDYLRTHPEDAHIYGDLKRSLAARFGNNREAYNEAKTEFVSKDSAPDLPPQITFSQLQRLFR